MLNTLKFVKIPILRKELGEKIDIKIAEEIRDFKTLSPITTVKNPTLKPAGNVKQPKIPFVLSKSWNLIQQVNFDVEKRKGDIISNVSYIDKDYLDNALTIMEDTYNSNPKYIGIPSSTYPADAVFLCSFLLLNRLLT